MNAKTVELGLHGHALRDAHGLPGPGRAARAGHGEAHRPPRAGLPPRGRSSAESASTSWARACAPFPLQDPWGVQALKTASPGKRATTSPSPPGAPASAFSSSCWLADAQPVLPRARKCCASDPEAASNDRGARAGPRRRLRPRGARATAAPCRPRRRATSRPSRGKVPAGRGPAHGEAPGPCLRPYGTLLRMSIRSWRLDGADHRTRPPSRCSGARSRLELHLAAHFSWRYEDLLGGDGSALRFALRRLDIVASEAEIARSWRLPLPRHLSRGDAGLAGLAGTPLGFSPTAPPRMLAAAVSSSGLEGKLATCSPWMPSGPTSRREPVYELGPRASEPPPARSSRVVQWPGVAGAKAFGYALLGAIGHRCHGQSRRGRPPGVTRLDEIPAKLS